MSALIEQALDMKPLEKMVLIETLIKSLDEPSPPIESLWLDLAKSRLQAYREGKAELVSFDEIFREE